MLSIQIKQTGWQQTALKYSFVNHEVIICSMQGSNCCFLARIQVSQETGQMVWYSRFSESFPQSVMIHTVEGWNRDRWFFLKFPCFFYSPVNFDNLISSSSSFSKPSLDIWKLLVCIMLKPSIQDFKHDLTSMERWVPFFGTTFLGDWMRTDIFQSCGHCWVFQNCWDNECRTLMASSFRDLNSFAGILSPLALLTAVLLMAHLTSDSRMLGSGW